MIAPVRRRLRARRWAASTAPAWSGSGPSRRSSFDFGDLGAAEDEGEPEATRVAEAKLLGGPPRTRRQAEEEMVVGVERMRALDDAQAARHPEMEEEHVAAGKVREEVLGPPFEVRDRRAGDASRHGTLVHATPECGVAHAHASLAGPRGGARGSGGWSRLRQLGHDTRMLARPATRRRRDVDAPRLDLAAMCNR